MSNTATPRAELRQLSKITQFLSPYKSRIALAGVALVTAALATLVIGQALRQVVDHGFNVGNPALLDRALLFLIGVISVMAAASALRFYFVSWLGERVTADLRRAVFSHLLSLSPGFFEVTRTGEVISRLTHDTTMLETVIGSSASIALRNLLLLLGGVVMLAITSPKLALLVLIGVPIVVAPILLAARRVRSLSRDSQDRVAEVGAYVDEALHEIRTVQAYGHENVDRQYFTERAEAAFNTGVRRIRLRAVLIAAVITLVFGAVGIILWSGGHDVLAGRLTAGELSAFVFYAVIVASSVGALSEVYGDLQRAAGATERLLELLATQADIRAPSTPQALPYPPLGTIVLHEVSFAYPSRPEHKALDKVSLRIERGEKVALVGPSGAGKTTLFQLLLRYYDPQSGNIAIDGVTIEQADPAELRSRIAVVPQDPVIFAASLAENVRYGRPTASDAEILHALDAAYAMEFVQRLPQGVNTFLGERGVRLSGGQRQRVAIARAILAERPILLLDEATSALDAESERMVQLALKRLMQDRTTLIVAHRLATVQEVDRIVVLEQGRIIGQGTHRELVQHNPLYARFAQLQFGLGSVDSDYRTIAPHAH